MHIFCDTKEKSSVFSEQGFTLAELVVVIGVFSLILVATSDIFMRSQKIQRRTAALERLQDDARYIMNKIASEIRAGAIDYGYYYKIITPPPDLASSIEELAIINFDGKKLRFKKGDAPCPDVTVSAPCILMTDQGDISSPSWGSATSKTVRVEKLTFMISPSKDPFTPNEDGSYEADEQPRVTIILALAAAVRGQQEPARTTLQTTVSTRPYKR